MCKYKTLGPSSNCLNYDYTALLTDNDINTIIENINRRRNFIALGHSNFLPGAANMKKISWSQELALSAQLWANQCDQQLQPDKEDQCRDIENMKVGQNIATITGPSAGFNVKSFVEIWFMQSLVYNGSVTYYNESHGNKSNQFTQLIWANTEKIGCGKAKFTVNNIKTTIVERLVCNFAPKGNVHGKPVYIIGYAATQCSDNMQPDKFFSGLCSEPEITNEIVKNMKQKISASPLSTSLLRIRNLFNDSEVKEIDPVYNNLKLIKNDDKNECLQIIKKSGTTTQDIFFVKEKNTIHITGSNSKRSAPEDDLNFKPFWQIDGYSNKKQQQLKSIKYTTLANKKNKKIMRTKSTPKKVFQTEHITIKFINEQKGNNIRITEKYLSFDELMHLRKFNTGNFSGRRFLNTNSDDNEGIQLLRNSNTSNSTKSTEYTANTPFIRMKQCTRKLTCTWTAASLTDSAGSIIPGGVGGLIGNVGSRTPPGYVEGCTRTSTCTRDYMNRNKMASLDIETTTPEFDTGTLKEKKIMFKVTMNETYYLMATYSITY
ncbi:uncharacterized protein LOC123655136 [Melitaea cinxia]|uniref:uncharacterized protein LOC123655136 n=1 Tax=Melitaea cinxia TaxID=113334 RepID=UPI001E26F318|nr:uncharacterized protein LOC123655136 [Melitaea cinxia]